jgi:hypothetical protein
MMGTKSRYLFFHVREEEHRRAEGDDAVEPVDEPAPADRLGVGRRVAGSRAEDCLEVSGIGVEEAVDGVDGGLPQSEAVLDPEEPEIHQQDLASAHLWLVSRGQTS